MMEMETSVFISPSSQSDNRQQMALGGATSAPASASASAAASRQLVGVGNHQLFNSAGTDVYYQSMRPLGHGHGHGGHHLSHHNLSLMNLNQIPSHTQLQHPVSSYVHPMSMTNGGGQSSNIGSSGGMASSAAFHGSLNNINLMASLAAHEQRGQRPTITVDYAASAAASASAAAPAPATENASYRMNNAPASYPSRPASASASLHGNVTQQSTLLPSAGSNSNIHASAINNAQQRYAQQAQSHPNALLMVAPSFPDSSHPQAKLLSPAHAAMWSRNGACASAAGNSLQVGPLPLATAPQNGDLVNQNSNSGAAESASPSESSGSLSNAPSCLQTSGSVGTSNGTGTAAGTGAHGSHAYSLVHKKRRYKEVAVMQPDGNGQPTYVCGVCGDRALGYNFDAITCESCKAFFRRNAQKMKPLKCNFDGNCKIDAQTRKFCPGCRLKKCISIGMRREWILSEEQLALRRQKGRVNKIRRQQQQLQQTFHHAGLPGFALLPASAAAAAAAAAQFARVPDEACFDASSTQRSASRSSSVCSSRSADGPNVNVGRSAIGLGLGLGLGIDMKPCLLPAKPDEIARLNSSQAQAVGLTVQVANAAGLRNTALWNEVSPQAEHYINAAGAAQTQTPNASAAGAPTNWPAIRPLSDVDNILLDVLQRLLYEVMEAVMDGELAEEPRDIDPHVGNYLKLTDSFIRRFIKFCKCVPEFSQLRQDDQIALLKGGVMEAIVLRGAILYDVATRRWHLRCPWTPDNQLQALSVDCLRSCLEPYVDGGEFLDIYVQFLDSLFELTQRNRLLMLLLLLIELFSTDRAGLVNKLQVSQAQEKYMSLLRHYLESLVDHSVVRRLFPALLLKLADARDVAIGLNRIFTKVDWSNVEPLLGEMFAPFTRH